MYSFSLSYTSLLQAYEEREIHRLVYFGGVDPSLRKEVWPFLLGHYQFTMTEKSRMEVFLYPVSQCVGFIACDSLCLQRVPVSDR